MTTYISILRGINVSGQKIIKMDALKNMYEGLKFKNIKTYVQSGNVIFTDNETDLKKLENKIHKQIELDFGFSVPVIVLTKEILQEIVNSNPFSKAPKNETSFLHVTFLADIPTEYDKELVENKKQIGEEIQLADRAVYLYCPNGYGKTKLNNSFLETHLKVIATTRNWKTTNELLNLATK